MLKNSVLEAKDVWKGYNTANGAWRWILQGINLEILEGDFIAILSAPGIGKSALLKVLSFREKVERGAVYFEGRLVGRSGDTELEQMRAERIWLLNGAVKGNKITVDQSRRPAAVLLDDPVDLVGSDSRGALLQIAALISAGVAVVIATSKPVVAARASTIYKLHNGRLDKIAGELR
ncbi:MAG: ATP-binding cassette domain-containing protein [Bacillota bacterium]